MKPKITYIISNIDKALAFEWICENLDRSRFDLSFVLLNSGRSFLEEYLEAADIPVLRITYLSKKNLPMAIWKLILFFRKHKPDVVHTHLFDAALAGLMAARICGIRKRIYTRHYSTYHHQYFPYAVKWDKLNNRLASHIVAISQTVKKVLIDREGVTPGKISLIHHGFDLAQFNDKNDHLIARLKRQYNPSQKAPVIGVISRFTELKGLQYIIPAFKKTLDNHPGALLLLFNATGDYEKTLDKQLLELPDGSYQKIRFENEITSIYHLFNLFIHVPVDRDIEAFGQTYIECMASGTPLIATKSGIGNEILVNRENAMVVSYRNSNEIYEAIRLLLSDEILQQKLVKNALKDVEADFQLKDMVRKLEALYLP